MHARVTTFTSKPGKIDEVIKGVLNTAPGVKRNKGSRTGFLLVDKKAGKGVIVAMWDTEVSLKAGEESAALKEAMSKFGPLLAQFNQGDYEVTTI